MFTQKYITKVITWAIHIAETEFLQKDFKIMTDNTDGLTWYVSNYMCAAIPTDGFILNHAKTETINVRRWISNDTRQQAYPTTQIEEIEIKRKKYRLRIFKTEDGTEYRVREDFLKLFSGLDGWYLTGGRDSEKVFVRDSADLEKSPVGIICCGKKR